MGKNTIKIKSKKKKKEREKASKNIQNPFISVIKSWIWKTEEHTDFALR